MPETQEKNGRTPEAKATELESVREQLRAEQRKNVEAEQRLRQTESLELDARRVAMPYLVREIEILRGQMEGSDDGE